MIGLLPDQFFTLTPWQFSLMAEAYADRKKSQFENDAWMMWHNAMLSRMDKPPPLSDFITIKKPVKGIDESAIIARLKAYQRRVQNGDSR